MKRIHCLLWLGCSIWLFACEPAPSSSSPLNESPTPETLLESESKLASSDLGLFSKGRYNDILQNLFEEAMENDKDLAQLHKTIEKFSGEKQKQLAPLFKYQENNQQYWSAAKNVISQLQDSTLRASTLAQFESLEKAQQAQLAPHNSALNTLEQRHTQLRESTLLLKLYITQEMMSNYQKNERPPVEDIQQLIKQLESLLQQTKAYIK